MQDQLKQWVKQLTSYEKAFERALRRYFYEQADRVAEAIAKGQVSSPEELPLIFRPSDENALLLPLIRRNIGQLMIVGATDELNQFEGRTRKDTETPALFASDELVWPHVPPTVRQRILSSLDELEKQGYWFDIQMVTNQSLTDIFKDGFAEGANNRTLAKRIQEALGEIGLKRSLRIARTETTGAMNSGHQAARDDLVEQGFPLTKIWLAISDDDVRESHLALNLVEVQPKASFNLAGVETPYPGHWSLPVGERANCRCTTITGGFDNI